MEHLQNSTKLSQKRMSWSNSQNDFHFSLDKTKYKTLTCEKTFEALHFKPVVFHTVIIHFHCLRFSYLQFNF